MNERLHNLLDGDAGAGNPIGSQEEATTFAELRRLQEALRNNAHHGGLSVAEKGAIGANLAAAIGFDAATPTAGAPAGASGSSSWLRNIGLLLLGAGLGAGIFFLTDTDAAPPPAPPTGIIIEAEATTPALFPFALAEPSTDELCTDRVAALRDSIRLLEEANTGPKRTPRKKYRKWKSPYPDPTPGD